MLVLVTGVKGKRLANTPHENLDHVGKITSLSKVGIATTGTKQHSTYSNSLTSSTVNSCLCINT